jgi:hypothetical protein
MSPNLRPRVRQQCKIGYQVQQQQLSQVTMAEAWLASAGLRAALSTSVGTKAHRVRRTVHGPCVSQFKLFTYVHLHLERKP